MSSLANIDMNRIRSQVSSATEERYRTLQKESARYGETNDCSVIATAMILELSYNESHALLHSLGRRARRGFSMRRLEATIATRRSPSVYPKQPNGSAYTVKTIPDLLPIGKFFVYTAGHVLALINGTIYDWTEDRKHRVTYYVEIDKPDTAGLLDLL